MEQRTMENVVKYYRRKYNLSQEEICDGICSVTTLSRLEKGIREIDSLLGQTILGRIGREVTLFETVLNEEDFGLLKIRTEIETSVENKESEAARKWIREYRKVMPQDESVHEQFCLYQEGLLLEKEKQPVKIICDVLERGIRFTIPDFGIKTDKKRLYSPVEIQMILLLYRYDREKEEILEEELLKVLDYIEAYYKDEKKEKIETKIYLELIHYHKQKENDEKILVYIDKLMKVISRGEGFYYLKELYFLRAKIMAKRADNENTREKCFKDCIIAYNLCEIEEDSGTQGKIAVFCEEVLKCQITEPEILLD